MKRGILIFLLATAVVAQDEPKRERPPLTDEQRAQKEQQLNDDWSKLPLEAKMRVMRLHHALTQLPPEERKFIHDRIGRFLAISREERQRMKENAERWGKMTPEEREQARQNFREHRRQFEEKWRQEHHGEEPPPFQPRHHKSPPENPEQQTETPTKETQ